MPDEVTDPVEEASEESFPASDSPAWAMGDEGRLGGVRNHAEENQFEISIDGKTAFLIYRRRPASITFLHTEVPAEMQGKGVGNKLAKAALEFARGERLKVISECPFVTAYLRRHPEYADLMR